MPKTLNKLDLNSNNKRIVVAMSGGVDSSVVAALLVDQGYDVIGITLQLYDHGDAIEKKGACCAGSDIYDAKRVASHLNIPHYVLDYESRFKETVIDDFVDEYFSGKTPIPCVRCNQTVKFNDLMKMAKDLNAYALATGHYVQRITCGNDIELHRGIDDTKDQSYFLFATTQDQLNFLRFPLGDKSKEETRALAEKFNLPVKDKPESQDICFVPNGKYSEVLRKFRPGAIEPGDIVHVNGSVIGKHNGIIDYTVGQRKGLGIGGNKELPEKRLYVIDIDVQNNKVLVGPHQALEVSEITLKDFNGINKNSLFNQQTVLTKLRNTGKLITATLYKSAYKVKIKLDTPIEGVSPGQAAVIYDFDCSSKVLGGGWIDKTNSIKFSKKKLVSNVA